MKKEIDQDHLSTREFEFESFEEAVRFIFQLFPRLGKLDNPHIKIRYHNKALVSINFSKETIPARVYLSPEKFCII